MKFLRDILIGALGVLCCIIACAILALILCGFVYVFWFLTDYLSDYLFNPTLKDTLIIVGAICLCGGLVFAIAETGLAVRPKDAIAEEYKEDE